MKKTAVGLTACTLLLSGTTGIVVTAQELYGDAGTVNLEQQTLNTETQSATVSTFALENHPQLAAYREQFSVPAQKIQVASNKPTLPGLSYDAMMDGDKETYWAPNTRDDLEKTEVEFTFDEIVTLDQLTYSARQNVGTDSGGFPHQFEIYGAMSDDAPYTLVASGNEATATKATIAIQFPKTQFKKLKFKFVETSTKTKWAHIGEIAFYQEDQLMQTMSELLLTTDKTTVNPDYATTAKLDELALAAQSHPFAADYATLIEDARILLAHQPLEATTATTTRFTEYENTAYNEAFKMPTSNIASITNNAGHYLSQAITHAIDDNLATYWETNKANSSTWNNEVTVMFNDRVTLNRLVFGARPDKKGFATKFEIYASKTTTGDTFELLASGSHTSTTGLIEAKFVPTEVKRVKLKFVESTQSWATLSELAFYHEDTVDTAMTKLFTDSSKSTLNPEYANEAALTQLEAAVAQHPLAAKYLPTLEDARILLERTPVQPIVAQTTLFTEYGNQAYTDAFKMPTSNIASITNNAGHYASQVITHAIDDNPATYWETNKANSSTWNNEVTVTLAERQTLNRLVFGARPDQKGFATKFEIYASNTAEGETFELIATGNHGSTNALVEAKFAPMEMKRIKLKYVSSTQNWATLTEFALYQEDTLAKIVGQELFVDKAQTELAEAYRSEEALAALEQAVLAHPANAELLPIMERAFAVLAGNVPEQTVTLTAAQDGDMNHHAKNVLRMSRAGQNLQATGVYGLPGEKIVIYVDSDETTVQPAIAFSQNNAKYSDWLRTYQLKPGRNELIVPEFDTSSYSVAAHPGGAIYIVNPYLPEQQGKTPTIRFEGGHQFPVYREGDDEAAFVAELTAYRERVLAAQAAGDQSVLDLLEVEGERVLISTRATDGYKVYVEEGLQPHQSTDEWKKIMNTLFAYHGIDGSSEVNDPKKLKEHIRLMQPHGMMYGSSSHVGIQSGHSASVLRVGLSGSWGFIHEVGHRLDNRHRELTEITNNMDAMYMSAVSGQMRDRVKYEMIYLKTAVAEDEEQFGDGGYFTTLGAFWQLQLANDQYWAEFNRLYRERQPAIANTQEKYDYIVKYSSEVFGINLTEHFARHGLKVSADVATELAATYPDGEKYWYLNTKAYNYQGTGLASDVIANIVQVTTSGKMHITSNATPKDLLGYEVLRDGEVIGFTRKNTFQIPDYDLNENHEYTVIPYGTNLVAGNESQGHLTQLPNLVLSQPEISLPLYAEFNPEAYVNAQSANGESLADVVSIESNVDMNRKGEYSVTYRVSDQGYTVEKTLPVRVLAAATSLTDIEWQSATQSSNLIKKDTNLSGGSLRLVNSVEQAVTYAKGLGTHANAEIVYDLTDKNYTRFESFVGIDCSAGNNAGSAIFEVYVDGVQRYHSDVMRTNEVQKHISLDITGASELKLVVTDNKDDDKRDYATWGDPRLLTASEAPTLTATEDIMIPLRSDFDLLSGVQATDVEDGDITSQVTVTTTDFDINVPGVYQVGYTVSDSDGNVATTQRQITVYSEQTYASDLPWVSATSGWKTVNKDSAVSVTSPIKLNVDGEIQTFAKGIGAAANAEIVYDLSDSDYEYFTSYVGTDKNFNDSRTSIQFIVLADGVEVYRSSEMGQHSPAEFVKIPVAGVKELRLLADNVDANGLGDFTSWGDAQFITMNAKPKLTVAPSAVYDVGTTVDVATLIGAYRAQDAEDGDLTAQVQVSGAEAIVTTKPGSYEVTYQVTDSHGNSVSKTRTISIIDRQDYDYLTDYEWQKATQSYWTTHKDTNIVDAPLRLTAADGTSVTYKRGIGAHANAEIIYDLSESDAVLFSTYVGVDRNVYNRTTPSLIFEVYVDGVKMAATDIMSAKDPQQYLEVSIAGANELKLIVNDGGNGNDYDHGSFGDTKLHYVNDDRANLKPLQNLVNEVEALDLTKYTAESVAVVQEQLVAAKDLLARDDVMQAQADTMYQALRQAVNQLVTTQFEVEIPDAALRQGIIRTLNLTTPTITNHDLLRLEKLDLEFDYVRNLEGLQYATNLTSLNVNFNEITDLRPLQKLEKLTDLQVQENFIDSGDVQFAEGNFTIEPLAVYDRDGSQLAPLEIIFEAGGQTQVLPLEEVYQNGVITIEPTLLGNLKHATVEIKYASETTEFSVYNFNWLHIPEGVEVNPIVEMPDAALKTAIIEALGLESDVLRINDLAQLTSLNLEYNYVRSLEGLQYAKNLTALNLNYNEVIDLRPLQNLTKLTDLQVQENFIDVGDAQLAEGNFTIEPLAVYDRDGSQLKPTEILFDTDQGRVVLPLEQFYQDDVITIRQELLAGKRVRTVEVKYSSETTDFSTYSFHWLQLPTTQEVNPIVEMPDQALKTAVMQALELTTQQPLRASDVAKLTTLNLEGNYVQNLAGLEYAVQLQTLNLNYNEVTDLRPLQQLPLLTDFVALENFVTQGEAAFDGTTFTIEAAPVYDRDGEQIKPTEIVFTSGATTKSLPISEVYANNQIRIDASLLGTNAHGTVEVKYESPTTDFSTYTFHWLMK